MKRFISLFISVILLESTLTAFEWADRPTCGLGSSTVSEQALATDAAAGRLGMLTQRPLLGTMVAAARSPTLDAQLERINKLAANDPAEGARALDHLMGEIVPKGEMVFFESIALGVMEAVSQGSLRPAAMKKIIESKIQTGRALFEKAHEEVLLYLHAGMPEASWQWMKDPWSSQIIGDLYEEWVNEALQHVASFIVETGGGIRIEAIASAFRHSIFRQHAAYNRAVLLSKDLPLASVRTLKSAA